ncbi:MAG: pyruvate:ferredoxin (flavodoxin) oxidoreductase [Cystobacterineae bacterium]|nr:pyruvate:ferredoxin (flavodoxin) oxidoreductase [Cystobacterineae bacterium]
MRIASVTIDANEAVASVAHRLSEVIAIYPITPSSSMGELSDEWSAKGQKNIWGQVPSVAQFQSEGGAAGAVHGALQAGALTTTFTASQGLLLMVPNLYKIAGELTPFCMHVAARTLATHALSIFGDHSDVMACRQTGFALLSSHSVQQAQDFAAIAHAAALKARVPFLHFFDGFRTSHEVAKIAPLSDETLLQLMPEEDIAAFRKHALSPDAPAIRGTAQNPDCFFQAREACNPFYEACPRIVQQTMDAFAKLTGRSYRLFQYEGHAQAERVVVLMGSGTETTHETVQWLCAQGERVGVLKVHLFRPFSAKALLEALPKTTRAIAVLDRTKEPGALGEPLWQDVVTALAEYPDAFPKTPRVVGGRFGLSSKEYTPAMAKAVFDELKKDTPKNHFTVGIYDDVSGHSLSFDASLDIEPKEVVRALFFGLGSDGTVGSNKNSIKIIGDSTPFFAQAYFVYDSKKSGAVTISHLRFGPKPIRSSYLIGHAGFVACHAPQLMEQLDVLGKAADGATFLLNTPWGPEDIWEKLPLEVQQQLIEKQLKFYVIDGFKVAQEAGLGRRISTVMQSCFFALSGILPKDEAIAAMKEAVQKTFGKRGEQVVLKNFAAIDASLAHLYEVKVPNQPTASRRRPPVVPPEAPEFVQKVTATMLSGNGDMLPVSAFPIDGTWPMGTTRWEKRAIALEIPIWEPSLCIQCNKCALVCPHAAIRVKTYAPECNASAPTSFRSQDYKGNELGKSESGQPWKYVVQVAPDDCTGCSVCVAVCPAKDKKNPGQKSINMRPVEAFREAEQKNFDFFLKLPEFDRSRVRMDVKGSQFLQPLFEFSGACAGCGETPYVKLLTQMFGERALIANATGCSSIYGGNLPTTPYCTNAQGLGPAWSNSLFEDNAEFGAGMRLALDTRTEAARALLVALKDKVDPALVDMLLKAPQNNEADIQTQRKHVAELKKLLPSIPMPEARRLMLVADNLVKKSLWILGGDGWAYDIGYGGVDHVLASSLDVNILVLDTEVYSNTGGQQSKATPLGAAAKFAAAGKMTAKKDLGLMAMAYGTAYVASIAYGAKDAQAVRAFQEAESFPGPSLLIALSPCIAHGYDLANSLEQQRLAVDSGAWPLYRFDPRRTQTGESPLQLDGGALKAPMADYLKNEGRFRLIQVADAQRYESLVARAQEEATRRRKLYEHLAQFKGEAKPVSG